MACVPCGCRDRCPHGILNDVTCNKQNSEAPSGLYAPWLMVLPAGMALALVLTWPRSELPESRPTSPASPSPASQVRHEWLGESDPAPLPPAGQKKPSVD